MTTKKKETLWDYLELEKRIEDRLKKKLNAIERHDFNPLRKHKER